jgi:hypothetical protein
MGMAAFQEQAASTWELVELGQEEQIKNTRGIYT